MRRLLVSVLVAGAAGLCAGCGSGDDTSSNAAATSTQAAVTTIEPSTTTTTAPTTTLTEPASPPATTTTTTTSTSPTTPAGPEKAAYIAKADAVCETGNADARKLNERANKAVRAAHDDKDRLRALAPILKDGLPIQTAALQRFKAVVPPAADRPLISGYWKLLDQQVVLLGQLADAAAAGDLPKYQQITARSGRLRDQARALARDYGFKKCGSGDSDAA